MTAMEGVSAVAPVGATTASDDLATMDVTVMATFGATATACVLAVAPSGAATAAVYLSAMDETPVVAVGATPRGDASAVDVMTAAAVGAKGAADASAGALGGRPLGHSVGDAVAAVANGQGGAAAMAVDGSATVEAPAGVICGESVVGGGRGGVARGGVARSTPVRAARHLCHRRRLCLHCRRCG